MNLAGQRLTVPEEKDTAQAKKAIEAVRALLPLCPQEEVGPIKDALSQLQMIYVRGGRRPRRRRRPRSGAGEAERREAEERAKARAKIWTPRLVIGIFGGSGFYRFLDDVEEVAVATPYGPPSAPRPAGRIEGAEVAFMPRHGDEHTLPPHRINYRANVWAMREVGVRRIVGPSACGSLQARARAGHVRGLRPVRGPHLRAREHLLRRPPDHPRVGGRPLLPPD